VTGTDIVRLRLAAVTAVTTVVSSRIYVLMLPQRATLPAIRLTLIPGGPDPLHLRGLVGTVTDRVQVDAFTDAATTGDPLETARAIADAVYGEMTGGTATGLAGWAGAIGSPATRVDLIEPAAAPIEQFLADELRQVVISQDYYVHYRAS